MNQARTKRITSKQEQIEQIKVQSPNFKCMVLTQYNTNLHDSRCRLLSIKRSTRFIQQFQELEKSKKWPLEVQLLDSRVPGLVMDQMLLQDACASNWMNAWCSIEHDSTEFGFHHGCSKASSMPQTCTNSPDSSFNLAQMCIQMMNSSRKVQGVWRNWENQVRENLWRDSRSENCDVVNRILLGLGLYTLS